jgi:glycosyltransferase involved in cell wall biosynthesis
VLAHLHIDYRRRSRFVCLLHQADLIVGVSRHVTGDFLRDGVPPARTKTIYNGIDFARLDRGEARDVRAELGIPPDTVVVTTVGSLIRRKGQDILIRAFAQLAADRDICLLIASEGPERAGYEALAAALGVAAKVRFLGYFPNLTALYQASDIIALASRADAFGLVLAEAGYYRLPAVATTVGGIPEVVEDGVTGLLVAPENPDALAAALGQLIDDPVQRRAFGQAAKERAERLFSVGQMVADFQDTYAALAQIPQSRLGWFGDAACAAPYLNAIRGLTT